MKETEPKVVADEITSQQMYRDLEKGVFGRMCYLIDKYGDASETSETKEVSMNLDVFENTLKDEVFQKEFVQKMPKFISAKIHNRVVVMGVLENYFKEPMSTLDNLIHSYVNPLKCMNKIVNVETKEEQNIIIFCLRTI